VIFLIHRFAGWDLVFPTKEDLLGYLRAHGFTRRQLYAYMIVEGSGIWQELAEKLPPGPENPACGTPAKLSDPF
jgi:hypothetical protein